MSQTPAQLAAHINAFLAMHATAQAAHNDARGIWAHIRSLAIHPLRESFNKAAVRAHSQPAIELEKIYGLDDIGGHYTLPQGCSLRKLEAYCMANSWLLHENKIDAATAYAQISTLAQILIELNPQLVGLRYNRNNRIHCNDIVMGVTSGFNVDDIQFFLDGNSFQKSMDKPNYARSYHEAARTLKRDGLGWVPAPQTLARITAQGKARSGRWL